MYIPTTSCVRCLVLLSKNVLKHVCLLPPLHVSIQDVLCISTSIWPLRPVLDALKHLLEMSLSMPKPDLFGPSCKKVPEYNDGLSYEKENWKKILYWAELYLHAKLFWDSEIAILGKKVEIAERAVGPFLDESKYNPIQQIDCGEREWFRDYIISIFQRSLKLNTSCRVPWGEVTVIATIRKKKKSRKKHIRIPA
ncbi:hypothetical protein Glove_74g44 [Diversispora epigaea]|uniref:Uncharacterized protein n=1 Tax=Diversispora epigaea TaxID=1348612 RepID=A0A397JDW5_9GLOM|nr:hypothetical protein Glove_74g44 [Diversispora epigaea]